jgi:hypothetical protein
MPLTIYFIQKINSYIIKFHGFISLESKISNRGVRYDKYYWKTTPAQMNMSEPPGVHKTTLKYKNASDFTNLLF